MNKKNLFEVDLNKSSKACDPCASECEKANEKIQNPSNDPSILAGFEEAKLHRNWRSGDGKGGRSPTTMRGPT